jgi:hypothetical protein
MTSKENCSHIDAITSGKHAKRRECAECVKTGARWVHLMKPLVLPAWSPNLNAFAERFLGSAKSECLERVVPLGEGHLRATVQAFVQHYHERRPHQGLGNELIAPKTTSIATARSCAVRGSAACSSSITARPRSPMGRVFAHDESFLVKPCSCERGNWLDT